MADQPSWAVWVWDQTSWRVLARYGRYSEAQHARNSWQGDYGKDSAVICQAGSPAYRGFERDVRTRSPKR